MLELDKPDREIILCAETGTRFADMPQQEAKTIFMQCVVMVCASVGIKDLPDDILKNMLIKMFFGNYSHITRDEFLKAFEMNLAFEYEVRVGAFGQFNCLFMSEVLNLFLKRKMEAVRELKKLKNSQQQDHPKTTDEQFYNSLVKFVSEKKEMPLAWNWEAAYRYMEKTGMITETVEEKKEFKRTVLAAMEKEKFDAKMTARDGVERMKIEDAFNSENITIRCRKEFVKSKLKMMIK